MRLCGRAPARGRAGAHSQGARTAPHPRTLHERADRHHAGGAAGRICRRRRVPHQAFPKWEPARCRMRPARRWPGLPPPGRLRRLGRGGRDCCGKAFGRGACAARICDGRTRCRRRASRRRERLGRTLRGSPHGRMAVLQALPQRRRSASTAAVPHGARKGHAHRDGRHARSAPGQDSGAGARGHSV